jgi:hypothetical protein
MKKTIICLANSKKYHGKCLAGIEVKVDLDKLVLEKNKLGQHKWIRPISDLEFGQLPLEETQNIRILDVLEIDCRNECPNGAHCENIFYTGSVKKVRTLGNTSKNLNALCDKEHDLIFENRGKALTVKDFNSGCYSLMLIKPKNPFFHYGDRDELRVEFSYNDNDYDFPITDPIFLDNIEKYGIDKYNNKNYYLSLSLAAEHNNWHTKLVAGVIEVNK